MTNSNEGRADALVTGATGLIGRWLLAALTARGRGVVAVVRDAKAREAELRAHVARLGGDDRRLVVVSGDVESPSLGLQDHGNDDWAGVRDVFHLAARYAFGMKPDEARRANVDGTLHALAWARARPALRRFVYVGGYRMTRPGPAIAGMTYPLSEADARRLYADHGAYEASKHESFMAFRAFVAEHGIPWSVVHPSGVIGDARTGETTQLTGLGETVARLWAGKLPALVGSTNTFVPVVTVDHLAAVLATVPERAETAGQELTVLDAATPPLPELVRGIAAHLGVPAPRRTLPVGLVRALPRALTGLEPETLGFLSEDRYDTASTAAHERAAGIAQADVIESVARWCDHLVSTRFGAEPGADRGAMLGGTFVVGDPRAAEIVYLHGIPWNGDAWKPVADRVGVPGLRPDLPGLGRSAPGDMDDAAWLDRLLEGLDGKVLLVGHSLGSGVAVRCAHAHPEKVRGVVLVAPAFLQRPASWTMQLSPIVSRVLARSTPASLAARLLPEALGAPPHAVVSAAGDLGRAGVARRVARAMARASRGEARDELRRMLGELTCPVVLVDGEHDRILVPHGAAQGHTIRGAGHVPHLTHVDEIAAIVAAAARSVRATRAIEDAVAA